jgi:hypothetical protein
MASRRILPVTFLAVLLLLVPAAGPAAAIGAFGPPVTVVDPTCDFDMTSVDAARDNAGVAHGFAALWGEPCNPNGGIDYFSGSGSSWTRQRSPYRGFVMAVAQDTTGTYLLYLDPATGIRITKRLTDGTFTPGRLLSPNWTSSVTTLGDVVADGGKWWAVWNENVAPGGGRGDEFDQNDLFQATTMSSPARNRQRITTSPQWDEVPALALEPGTAGPVTMIWARMESGVDEAHPNPAGDLRRALGSRTGATWTSNSFATLGEVNYWPDVTVGGGRTWVTWFRDGRTVVADGTASFTSHTFATPSDQRRRPRVALLGTTPYVGWTAFQATVRAFVAVRGLSGWTGAYAAPSVPARDQILTGLVPAAGKATALIVSDSSRLYATTES